MKNKYFALIVDDDPNSVEQLAGFLKQTDLFAEPYICSTSTQAVTALYDHSFDILFLDIELPDMSALDLLRMSPKHPPVCAVSAHPAYAVDCYELGVDDFMVKPLTYLRVLRSIRRVLLKVPVVQEAPPVAMAAGPPTPVHLNHIYLKTGRQLDRFTIDDIVYLEAYHIYSKLMTSSGSAVVNEQLSRLEEKLAHSNFIRIHKSFLINLAKVTQYKANTIWLGNVRLPIGAVFKSKLRERLKLLGIL